MRALKSTLSVVFAIFVVIRARARARVVRLARQSEWAGKIPRTAGLVPAVCFGKESDEKQLVENMKKANALTNEDKLFLS